MIGKSTTISIRRTIQTAPYESSTVEITEEFIFSSKEERSTVYKELSRTLEGMVNHEFIKYSKGKKK